MMSVGRISNTLRSSLKLPLVSQRMLTRTRLLSTASALEDHNDLNPVSNTPNPGAFKSAPAEPDIQKMNPKSNINLVTSINQTLRRILETDPNSILFGQDIGFGGVFRCTLGLQSEFGKDRVFNTPLNENGIVGMAIGYATTESLAIAEIQFADYIWPGVNQLYA